MDPPDQTNWTQEERDEFAACGYVSFKSEAEVDAWRELACAELFAALDEADGGY